jgi:hypothetical protein
MPTIAGAFPIVVGKNVQEQPNTGFLGARQNSDVAYLEEDMPPRRHVESDEVDEFALRESMNVLMLASTSMCKALEAQVTKTDTSNGATNKRVTWLMAIFAMVTLMGTGANFLTSSGVAIGGKQQELQSTQKDVQRLQSDYDKLEQRYERSELKLREYEVWLQTTREKLADKGWKLAPLPKQE